MTSATQVYYHTSYGGRSLNFHLKSALCILTISLSACKTATVDMQYATTGIGIQNASRDPVGRVYSWQPNGGKPTPVALLFEHYDDANKPPEISIRPFPNGKTKASQIKGFVTSNNFNATSGQKASIEANATSSTQMEYSNYKVYELNKSVTAMSRYINGDPNSAVNEWDLPTAIASHNDSDTANDTYFVIVYSTLVAEKSKLSGGTEVGSNGSLDVPSVNGKVSLKYTNTSSIECDGFQECFAKVRIYRPKYNDDGNYSFTTKGVGYSERDFARAQLKK